MRRLVVAFVTLAVLGPAGAGSEPARVTAEGRPGRMEGVTLWTLPDTPNGLRPTQSWHATGSTPDGDVYVAGMDHETNSAFYRLQAGRGDLRLVGDARSASEAAGNWRTGETAQKLHTRPTFLDGKVYVATMDRSKLDAGYFSRRGFHWYAYDVAVGRFEDVSARDAGGVGAPHGSLVTLTADPDRKAVYGAAVPTGEIYRLDAATGRSENLGRPAVYATPYLYTGRVMWVDRKGRLYFTAGNPVHDRPDEIAHGNVHYHDPATGMGEMRDWRLAEPRALETGRCAPDRSWCVFADDRGQVYRFREEGPTWEHVGKVDLGRPDAFLWTFQVTDDGRRAYAVETVYGDGAGGSSLFEFDLGTGRTTRLCALADLDPSLAGPNVHTGYDAWDGKGRFHFASFAGDGSGRVTLTRVDPASLPARRASR